MRRIVLLGFLTGSASTATAQTPAAPRLRVAVADLSGSALKMQMTQMPVAGQPMAPYQPPPTGQQTTVTVSIPPPSEFARGLTEMLTSILVRTGRFVVLERAALAQLTAEQGLGAAGTVTKESAAAAGAMLGAQAIITGDITGFTFQKSSVGGALANVVPGLAVASQRVTAEVIIDLRLIDAASGEVLFAAKGRGKASQTGAAADLTRDEKRYQADAQFTTPLGQASRQAIQEAVLAVMGGMPKLRWSALVVDVRDGVVYLNAAAADGVRPGLALEVFERGAPLVDPSTGQTLGAPEKKVGTITVEEVFEKHSTARLGDGTAGKGNLVRIKAP